MHILGFSAQKPHGNVLTSSIKEINRLFSGLMDELPEMKFVTLDEKDWLKRQGYSKKILLTEEDLNSKGNIVQIVKNDPHTEIKPHYHNNMKEIYHILKGNAIIFCGDKRVRAKPGDTLLCEPKEVHGVVNDTDEEFLFVVFKIDAKDEDMYWA